MTGRTAGGPRSPSAALGVLCVLVLLVAAFSVPGAGQDDSTPEQDVLHLTERPFQDGTNRWNFTVFPPDENESTAERRAEQRPFPTFRADWTWYLPSALANWSIDAGARWELHLFLSGLDEVHPIPTFTSVSSGTAGHELLVEVRKGEDLIGQGSNEILLVDVEEGIQRYSVDIAFEEGVEFSVDDNIPSLLFDISMSGRGSEPESPLVAHFGSQQHLARLSAPAYPIDSLRALEVDYLLRKECAELILQQRSCEELQRRDREDDEEAAGPDEDEDDPDDDEGTGGPDDREDEPERSAPAATVLLPLLLSLSLLGSLRRGSGRKRRSSGYFQGEPAGSPPHWSR